MEVIRHHWGESVLLFQDDRSALYLAHGKKGGASSTHYHRRKSNTFILVSGEVQITSGESDDRHAVSLVEGQSYTIPSGLKHRMTFGQNSTLYEFYHADPITILDPRDIVRLDEGSA
jgi:mannose-6-phosphate isomerase-like protein (cupin superfamily)